MGALIPRQSRQSRRRSWLDKSYVVRFLPRFTWDIAMADTSTMSSKGQVVVPKRVREALQANSGARIGFELKGDKAVMFVVRKKTAKPEDGYGLVKGKGLKVALEDWNAKLGAALRREHARR